MLTGTVDGTPVRECFEADIYNLEIAGFVDAVAQADQTGIRSSYADACQTLALCLAANAAVSR